MSESKYKLDERDLEKILAICKSHGSSRKVKVVRRILRLVNSLILALPEAYVKSLGLKSGDRVKIYFNDYLHIKPIKTKLER